MDIPAFLQVMLSRNRRKKKGNQLPGSGKTHLSGARPSKVPTSILGGQSFTGFNFCLVRQIAGVLKTSQNVNREGIEGAPSDSIDTVSVADNSIFH